MAPLYQTTPKHLLVFLLFVTSFVSAWSLPSFLQKPFFENLTGASSTADSDDQRVLEVENSESLNTAGLRIAIIGAGAGGSSAAFWTSLAKKRHNVSVHVDIYEQSDYIGGRKSFHSVYASFKCVRGLNTSI
jgi:hypothetical protein